MCGDKTIRAQRLATREPTVAFEQLALAGLAGAAMTLAYVWLSWILSVGGTRFIVDTALGRSASIESGLRRLLQRLGTTSAAFLVSLLWGLLVGVLCMLPGAALTGLGIGIARSARVGVAFAIAGFLLWILGAIVALVWYAVRFMLTAEVLAMEEGGPLYTLRRSGELVSGRLGEGFFNLVKVRAAILVHPDHAHRRRHQAPRGHDRHALHESGPVDGARGLWQRAAGLQDRWKTCTSGPQVQVVCLGNVSCRIVQCQMSFPRSTLRSSPALNKPTVCLIGDSVSTEGVSSRRDLACTRRRTLHGSLMIMTA